MTDVTQNYHVYRVGIPSDKLSETVTQICQFPWIC